MIRVLPTIFLLSLLCALPQPLVHAQSASVRCPKEPLNLDLFEKSLVRTLRDQVDENLYSKPVVRIRFRRLGITSRRRDVDLSTVLTGLTTSLTNLVASASGGLTFLDSCEYSYLLRITVIGTEISTGVRLSTTNDSAITITSSGESELRRIRNRNSEDSSS